MESLHFSSVKEFYPYYLTQHRNLKCRSLHFIGTGIVILLLTFILILQEWWLLILLPVVGYGFAWAGHFLFERNKPAAFKNPLYSLACDFIMFWHIITGRISSKIKEAENQYPQFCN